MATVADERRRGPEEPGHLRQRTDPVVATARRAREARDRSGHERLDRHDPPRWAPTRCRGRRGLARRQVLHRERARHTQEPEPGREPELRDLGRPAGIDLVVEGKAERVTDDPTLQRLADEYKAQGWDPKVKDGAFTARYSAPSAGPPPWDLYEITPTTAFGVATGDPQGATRWRFKD